MPSHDDATPEEMLTLAEEIDGVTGISAMVGTMGGDGQAFIAMVAVFGLIMQDIKNNNCPCDVCTTLRDMQKRVTGE